ncbi:orotate phosphoribosyltransferase [Turicimonas muris]|uniref:orotate phosphoribosyltransferase n=1 Tax=Turicimonas muris TaxID=1796652 RepID=UPI00272AEAF8|nr:orotate phosphoribosyltransferase [Turicimonas muris]
MSTLQQNFIQFCIDSKVLRFGEFKTKAGRLSPYFFNAGLFNTGSMLHTLSDFYAKTLIAAIDTGRVKCDMVFGPAYKGIPLGCAVAIRMAELGRDLPFAFNRKEAKDHGEGGSIVGAPLQGNVVIIDDVISAGTSVRESVDLIRANGAVPSGVLIAMDRMECAGNAETIKKKSAVQEVEERYGIPVCSIASLKDLMSYLKNSEATEIKQYEKAIEAYRRAYGA